MSTLTSMPMPIQRSGSTSSSYTDFEDLDVIRACGSFQVTGGQDHDPDGCARSSPQVPYPTPSTSSGADSAPRSTGTRPANLKRALPNESDEQSGSNPSPRKIARLNENSALRKRDQVESPYEFKIGAGFSPGVIRDIRAKLTFGVQFELARLTTTCEKDAQKDSEVLKSKLPEARIPQIFRRFFGSNEVIGPHVEGLAIKGQREDEKLIGRAKELSAKAPWKELDREMLALKENPFGCVGTPNTTGQLNVKPSLPAGWYGGQVVFSAKLVWTSGLRLELVEPEIGASTRFTRRFGSDFILRVRMSRDVSHSRERMDLAFEFLYRPLVIFGRVYRFFYANKERVAFYIATNEGTKPGDPDNTRFPGFLDFVEWFNPMHVNSKQTMAKYIARFALGLSNSIPGIELDSEQIINIPDIISNSYSGHGKVPTEMEMTDGCGLINLHALQALYSRGFWDKMPTAIQCRIQGGKGILLLDPKLRDVDHPVVHIRPSQTKIKYPDGHAASDPTFRTIDVLRAAHMKSAICVGREMIVNLWHNGVPAHIFQRIMREQIEELVDDLLAWEKASEEFMPTAMIRLWQALEKLASVGAQRAIRNAPGTARVRGLSSYEKDGEEDDDDEDGFMDEDARASQSVAWFPDEISGCPSVLEETVMTFIEGGFTPKNNGCMADKLRKVSQSAVRNLNRRYRIRLPMSCTAFCVPDPVGVLEEGEVHIKCSNPTLLLPDGRRTDKVSGAVLVSRNPCKLPTDIRKVKAVYKAELDEYNDVVIFSTKGSRSLASILGGGDYDGDRVEVIWQPDIVAPFVNASVDIANTPPNFEADNFRKENETVEEFMKQVPASSPESQRVRQLQERLVRPLGDLPIALYSNAHTNATFLKGYDHPDTLRLARMFCTVLDGAKTGITVSNEIQARDKKLFKTDQKPHWMERVKPSKLTSMQTYIARDTSTMGEFILTTLNDTLQSEVDNQLGRIHRCFEDCKPHRIDKDLTASQESAMTRAKALDAEEDARDARLIAQGWKPAGIDNIPRGLGDPRPGGMYDEYKQLDNHVRWVYDQHKVRIGAHGPAKGGKGGGKEHRFSELPIETRQNILRSVSRLFDSFPPKEGEPGALKWFTYREAVRLRASLAYYYASYEAHAAARFPWDVAMRELCDIKAKTRPDWRTLFSELHDAMRVRKI